MPKLTYTTFDDVAHTHELREGRTRIGRTPDNDLQIDDLAVSSRHCEINNTGGVLTVKDLDSVAGTFVEGESITEKEIKPGQTLSLGAFLIDIRDSADRTTPPPLPRLAPAPLEDGSYSCLRHQTRRAVFECDECFDLSCEECVAHDTRHLPICPGCGHPCEPIDWSGLDMTRKQALVTLLPEKIQKALKFWQSR